MMTFGRVVESARGLFLRDGTVNGATANEAASLSSVATLEVQGERECIRLCRECHSSCLEAVSYCVRLQGYYAELGHLRLLEDCAKICEVTVDFMLRGSETRGALLELCADVSERCARDCERFDYDQRLLDGAAACRRCADGCRRVAP